MLLFVFILFLLLSRIFLILISGLEILEVLLLTASDLSTLRIYFVIDKALIIFGEAIVLTGDEFFV
jgi:hypothetical protein